MGGGGQGLVADSLAVALMGDVRNRQRVVGKFGSLVSLVTSYYYLTFVEPNDTGRGYGLRLRGGC